jgi:4-hydroxythreonine-4-phosphate dehydrogenase
MIRNKEKDKERKVRVGISHGDFNGISYEIIIKTFLDKRMLQMMTPVIYGSSKIASYYRKTLNYTDISFNLVRKADMANPNRVNIINCYDQEVKIEIGKLSEKAGELAVLALEKVVSDMMHDTIDVLVTAPINKKSIQSEAFDFPGHTEYLAKKFNTDDYLMMMVSENLRIGIITGHIPLKDVSASITEDLLIRKIKIMNDSLIKDFAIRKPKIAVLGLNPHAGDDGVIGNEESEIIIPAVKKSYDDGILCFGPYPADGFFGSASYTKFDGIISLYHDQGMLPFKALAFDSGVNFTAGLPYVRTSPAHGTAFDIAGKKKASPDSFRKALFLAVDIFKNRKIYEEISKNPLPVGINGNGKKPEDRNKTQVR